MIDFEQVEQIASELTPRYIAGFFDGEGSVSYSNRKQFSLQVCISQNNETVLLAIAKYFGFGVVSKTKRVRGHKDSFILRWCGQKARVVLEALEPYLFVKREQARLGIKLAKTAKSYGDHTPVSQELTTERDSLAAEIRRLNDSHWSRRPKDEMAKVELSN